MGVPGRTAWGYRFSRLKGLGMRGQIQYGAPGRCVLARF